ncbi:MAG: hypothetical protein QNI95_18190, partial [Desulfobacterales bacterium]|nr:hypothetical protein [Desulfobacterales bacterium]
MSKKSGSTGSRKKSEKSQGIAAVGIGPTNITHDSENWSLSALESAPFGVMIHDKKGKILMFNSQL